MTKHIDLIYRADEQKGAADGGEIRNACKAVCNKVEYSVTGISARLHGIDDAGRQFCEVCPGDCIIEIIGGDSAVYQAEVVSW